MSERNRPEVPISGQPALVRALRSILLIQGLRAALYGFGSVLIGSFLRVAGFSDVQVGLVFTAMLAGMALSSVVVGVVGDRVGRRRCYGVLLLLMGVAGAVYALSDWFPALLIAALTGTLSTDPNESGPITSLEQAMIGEARPETRLHVFGRYNAIAYLAGAVGSLAAAGVAALSRLHPSMPSTQRWLLLFPVIAIVCAWRAFRISSVVELSAEEQEEGDVSAPESVEHPRRVPPVVVRLSALFALDSFAGGFVVQTFLVFWFGEKFGASPELMGTVFFVAGLLQAVSSVIAARVGIRFGLLNTMVFTHLPSNVLLIAVPFMPTLVSAIAVLLARYALSQMDVPARQAFVAAVVEGKDRTGAAAYTNTARYVSRPAGPFVAGALMSTAIAAPFVVAGGLKIVYDVTLYATFRRVPLPSGSSASPPSSS
ncbi:MAG: MFS transporter [Actinomycetota bacterium]